MPSLLDSPPQIPAAGAWGSLYVVQEPVKPRHWTAVPLPADAVTKKPAYGARKKNLEMCTEALGCETGAVDTAPAAYNGADDKGDDAEVEEAECAERKRRAREEEEEEMEGRARQWARRPLPPPLTTRRARMVHERRDGRLAVYAVRTPGMEAERSGGRLRMRLVSLSSGSFAACRRQEAQDAEAKEVVVEAAKVEEEECGVAKYVRGGRCVEPEGAAATARRGKQWEAEQTAAFWVATS